MARRYYYLISANIELSDVETSLVGILVSAIARERTE
jgi:hypothetical protein